MTRGQMLRDVMNDFIKGQPSQFKSKFRCIPCSTKIFNNCVRGCGGLVVSIVAS